MSAVPSRFRATHEPAASELRGPQSGSPQTGARGRTTRLEARPLDRPPRKSQATGAAKRNADDRAARPGGFRSSGVSPRGRARAAGDECDRRGLPRRGAVAQRTKARKWRGPGSRGATSAPRQSSRLDLLRAGAAVRLARALDLDAADRPRGIDEAVIASPPALDARERLPVIPPTSRPAHTQWLGGDGRRELATSCPRRRHDCPGRPRSRAGGLGRCAIGHCVLCPRPRPSCPHAEARRSSYGVSAAVAKARGSRSGARTSRPETAEVRRRVIDSDGPAELGVSARARDGLESRARRRRGAGREVSRWAKETAAARPIPARAIRDRRRVSYGLARRTAGSRAGRRTARSRPPRGPVRPRPASQIFIRFATSDEFQLIQPVFRPRRPCRPHFSPAGM